MRWVRTNASRGTATRRIVCTFDTSPGSLEQVDRPSAEHLDADIAQDPQPRLVDRLDLVGAQDLDRRERVDDPPPGQPRDPAADPPLAPRPATQELGIVGHDGHDTMRLPRPNRLA